MKFETGRQAGFADGYHDALKQKEAKPSPRLAEVLLGSVPFLEGYMQGYKQGYERGQNDYEMMLNARSKTQAKEDIREHGDA